MAELIFPTGFDEKTTIAQDDMILMADSEDDNKIKKAKYSNLKGEKGDPGQNGQDGKDGKDGADGQDGQDGTDGASIVSGAFVGDDLVFGKDDGTNVTIENAKTTLQGPEGEEGPEGPQGPAGQDGADGTDGEDGNGIASITSSKSGKITTVTITETNGDSESFQISDGQDGQGSGDVIGPNSSTDEDIALFDGVDGKHIKDGGKKLSDLVQTSGNQTVNGVKTFGSEPVLPSKSSDAGNNATKPATEAQVYKKQDTLTLPSSPTSGNAVTFGANNKTLQDAGGAPVLTSGNQTINGTKTFGTSPVVPSKTADATNTGTAVATEAQVYKKQNTISSSNKLDADLVDDSNSTNKFVTASDKNTWNGKQNAIDSNNKLSADYVSNGTNNRVCVVGSTAPSTPSEGDLWYDTANDVLKSYNGSTWDEAGGSGGGIQTLPGSPVTQNYVWIGSEQEYEALTTHRTDTEYKIY